MLLPLLETRCLSVPGHGDNIMAAPGFHLFATQRYEFLNFIYLGPVVENFDSLTLLLNPQFVNYISTLKANTLLFFFVEKM